MDVFGGFTERTRGSSLRFALIAAWRSGTLVNAAAVGSSRSITTSEIFKMELNNLWQNTCVSCLTCVPASNVLIFLGLVLLVPLLLVICLVKPPRAFCPRPGTGTPKSGPMVAVHCDGCAVLKSVEELA